MIMHYTQNLTPKFIKFLPPNAILAKNSPWTHGDGVGDDEDEMMVVNVSLAFSSSSFLFLFLCFFLSDISHSLLPTSSYPFLLLFLSNHTKYIYNIYNIK
jgi:hypothetical protein